MKKKTNRTAKKRFKLTGTNKILRGHAYSSHNKNKKSKSRLRRQKEPTTVSPGFEVTLKRLIGK